MKAFDRARFGRRSEKLAAASVDDEQQAFVFEEIETGIAAIMAKVTNGSNKDGKRPPGPRKSFAPHLERIEVVIEPEDLPEHAGKTKNPDWRRHIVSFGEGRRYGSKPDFYGLLFTRQLVGHDPKLFGGQTCQLRHFPIEEYMIKSGIID